MVLSCLRTKLRIGLEIGRKSAVKPPTPPDQPSKLQNKRQKGALYEQQARQFLEQQGLKWLAQNQQFKCGELDLIMQQGDTFVFVEVRHRHSSQFGSAVESIDWRKQQKWRNAANSWLAQRNQSLDTADCRFDVVAFEGDDPPLWIKNFLG